MGVKGLREEIITELKIVNRETSLLTAEFKIAN